MTLLRSASILLLLGACAAPPSTQTPDRTDSKPVASVPKAPAPSKGRQIHVLASVQAAIAACPALGEDRTLSHLNRTSSNIRNESAYSFVVLCSDDPSHGWAYTYASARHHQTVIESARYVGGGGNALTAHSANSKRAMDITDIAAYHLKATDAAKQQSFTRARPPMTLTMRGNLAPEGYVWPDGSPITNPQLAMILVTDITSKVSHFQQYLPAILAKYERPDFDSIAQIPEGFAQRDPQLLALVQKSGAQLQARTQTRDAAPSASFEAIDAFMRPRARQILNLRDTQLGYGKVQALDRNSPCGRAVFEQVAKLARNHETMVLRPKGNDLNYFRDAYRYLFQATNIANMNAKPDMEFDEFVVRDSNGTQRTNAIAIVPNATCTAAYARIIYFGATTSRTKYYAVSSARIDSDFLKTPNSGKVSLQYFREEGFSNSSGSPADFSYQCDADTCQRKK